MAKAPGKSVPEGWDRAIRVAPAHTDDYPSWWPAVVSVGEKMGCSPPTLHEWVEGVEIGDREHATYEFVQTLNGYRMAASRVYVERQNSLGRMYQLGSGVAQDFALAASCYHRAAVRGSARGQVNLGVMYAKGIGVARNYARAASWFRKAADQGNAAGQVNLGQMFADGKGVVKDYDEASRWYQRAADQGNTAAQLRLGRLYETGRGVARDNVQAFIWYNLSAAGTTDPALLDYAVQGRNRSAALLTRRQIAEAQRHARLISSSDYS
jgi:hypothetical protein